MMLVPGCSLPRNVPSLCSAPPARECFAFIEPAKATVSHLRRLKMETSFSTVEHDRILKLNPNGAEIWKLRCGGQIEAISN
jgi:hypothetical protein